MNIRFRVFVWCFLVLASCREQGIGGEWKPVRSRFNTVLEWQTPIEFDLSKPDSIKAILLEARQHEQELGAQEMTVLEKETDSIIRVYQKARLILKKNNHFSLISNGFIIPQSIPGWHFGDVVTGDWSRQQDTLTLRVGGEKDSFSFRYLILKQTNDSLILGAYFSDDGGQAGQEITFVRK